MNSKSLGGKFWVSLILFSLIGQVAWVVENMYLNVFIFEEFSANSTHISMMVSLSAISATLSTLIMGALSDKLGKRKAFITVGYIIWGITIFLFSLIRMNNLTKFVSSATAITLGISLVIILDCVMTFFGSTSNDACFNAWVTDKTDDSNRGKVEGVNSAMPLISILVVFGSMMFVPESNKWNIIFTAIGVIVLISGILGFFLIDEAKLEKNNENYFKNIIHGFRIKVIKENKLLYLVLLAYMVFGVVIQIFMPYLIIYYQYSLSMDNYVLIMAPAIVIASIFTVLYGKVIDKKGFKFSINISLLILLIGLFILFLFKDFVMVFVGSLFMMMGYLSGGACFASVIRSNTPKGDVGSFQGIRMTSYVLAPMIIGPFIGSAIIENDNAQTIIDSDGTIKTVPNSYIFLASFIVCLLIFIILHFVYKQMNKPKPLLSRSYKLNDEPLLEYPRVNLKRDSYLNLNGVWDFKIVNKKLNITEELQKEFNESILVPYPVESYLSRVNKRIKKNDLLIYRKSINIDSSFIKDTTILNIDGLDQFATILINGKTVCNEVYVGYTRYSVDVSNYIHHGSNEIVIICLDNMNINYPYGKQTNKPHGMWYTPCSGIFKTVWLESVSASYIKSVAFTSNIDKKTVDVKLSVSDEVYNGVIEVYYNDLLVNSSKFNSNSFTLQFNDINLWSDKTPNLYDVVLRNNDDTITSYFAFRLIECINKKFYLNHKPIFFNGLLDQGYFSDGLFTPNSYDDYLYDIKTMKELGFNTLRKHIKIEPDYFYYLCDKEGMFVWQDFVNNSKYSFILDTALPTIGKKSLNDLNRHKGINREIFLNEMGKTVSSLYNHPSIVLWTIFNEGWGQFDSLSCYHKLLELDTTRLIDATSGWFDSFSNDIQSEHVYFKKIDLNYSNRCVILSEFGGYSYKVDGHYYSNKTYGYKFYKDSKEFEDGFVRLYTDEVIPQIKKGLQAAIYTQVSDVEEETNGLFTYDRFVLKVDKTRIKELMDKLYKEFE